MTNGSEDRIPNLEFTYWAREKFYDVADDPYFRKAETAVIYASLKEKMRLVPFGDYLKRYLFEKAVMSGQYTQIPLDQYVETVCLEFYDRQTPCSFRPTSVRMRNAARNWLEQQTVSRSVVLLLGFGLGMSPDDVNDFLTKALQEPMLNAKDPFEVICWYCYRMGRGFPVFQDLWSKWQTLVQARPEQPACTDPESTLSYQDRFSDVRNEEQLFGYCSGLPLALNSQRQSVSARERFDALYLRAREHVADILTQTGQDDARILANRLQDELSRDDRVNDEQRLSRVSREKEHYTVFRSSDVTPADLESILFAAVPQDSHGNLLPVKSSSLREQFAGKRLSRQRISEILSGDAPITRFDLITLNFFNVSQEDFDSSRKRYASFIDSSNRLLRSCGMGPVYVVNPYECFLLMCMLTEDPLGTFADVWERSYDES